MNFEEYQATLSGSAMGILETLAAVRLRRFMYFEDTYAEAWKFFSTFKIACWACGVSSPSDDIYRDVAAKFGLSWGACQGLLPPKAWETTRDESSIVGEGIDIELSAWREFYKTDYPPEDDPLYFLTHA